MLKVLFLIKVHALNSVGGSLCTLDQIEMQQEPVLPRFRSRWIVMQQPLLRPSQIGAKVKVCSVMRSLFCSSQLTPISTLPTSTIDMQIPTAIQLLYSGSV